VTERLGGIRPVQEALRGRNRRVHEVWIEAGPDRESLDAVARSASDAGVEVRRVDGETFAGLGLEGARRAAARVDSYRYREDDLPEADPDAIPCLAAVLDHVKDPQNLGAIARTAEAVGCRALCIPRARAAAVTPAVVRASAGATEHLPIYRLANVARTVEMLKERGWWMVGLDAEGADDWDRVDYRGAIGLVVGEEGTGLRRLVRERCDFRVTLPMAGAVASLNVSAAFSAVAYEAFRQQRAAAG